MAHPFAWDTHIQETYIVSDDVLNGYDCKRQWYRGHGASDFFFFYYDKPITLRSCILHERPVFDISS